MRLARMSCVLLVAAIGLCPAAPAQRRVTGLEQRYDPGQDIGIDQRLGAQLPLDARFVDESGAEIALGEVFGDRPVLLALVYYECPMLCTLVLNGLLDMLRVVDLEPGADYELVVVSIDPEEGPALASSKKAGFLEALERPDTAESVHFLTGGAAAIESLAAAVGFRYVYDEEADEFAHASGIMVVTPDGRMSRYLYGVEYSARDARLSLIEASGGAIGSLTDQVLLLCYAYDPTTGRYGLAIMTSIRIVGGLTLGALLLFVVRSLRRDRKRLAGVRSAREAV